MPAKNPERPDVTTGPRSVFAPLIPPPANFSNRQRQATFSPCRLNFTTGLPHRVAARPFDRGDRCLFAELGVGTLAGRTRKTRFRPHAVRSRNAANGAGVDERGPRYPPRSKPVRVPENPARWSERPRPQRAAAASDLHCVKPTLSVFLR